MIYNRKYIKRTMDFSKRINGTNHILLAGDCIKRMKQMPSKSVDLIITDPPYNIGLDYGKYKDRLKKDKYIEWCKLWLTECARLLKKSGNLFLINYPENNAYLMPFMDNELKLIFRRWITWHYPTNIGHSKKNFTRSQRSILFYSKTKNNKFYKSKILQPYKNPDDKRVHRLIQNGKRGRLPYDTINSTDLKQIWV